MKMKLYGEVNQYPDCKLLEVAFMQYDSDKNDFARECMFANEDWIDEICSRYDYTNELPDSELYYTTYQKIRRYGTCQEWEGEDYIVMVDCLDNICIYRKIEGDIQEDSDASSDLS